MSQLKNLMFLKLHFLVYFFSVQFLLNSVLPRDLQPFKMFYTCYDCDKNHLYGNRDSLILRTINGETHLQLAISHNLPDVVEALCRRGIDMSVVDSNNNCPLWTALDAGQEDIASILVRSDQRIIPHLFIF